MTAVVCDQGIGVGAGINAGVTGRVNLHNACRVSLAKAKHLVRLKPKAVGNAPPVFGNQCRIIIRSKTAIQTLIKTRAYPAIGGEKPMSYVPFSRRAILPASMLITLWLTFKVDWHLGGHAVDH